MKLTFADWLIILVFGLASFFHFRGFGFSPAEERMTAGGLAGEMDSFTPSVILEQADRRRMLLFMLDFRDFSCLVCLESFIELNQRLPLHMKIQDCWGILIVPPGREEDDAVMGIAEKKLEGFIRAHQILFPVLVDRYHVFTKMGERGSGVILLDGAKGAVSRFDFPLRSGEFQEILEILAK